MGKKSFVFTGILVFFAIVLSACSPQPTVNDLSGTSWHLVTYGPAAQQIPAADGVTTLVQFSADGQVSGSFGCNQFSGHYQVRGDKVTFDQIISTMMACPGMSMDQESTSFQVFTGTARFELDGNNLVIQDAGGQNAMHLTRLLPE